MYTMKNIPFLFVLCLIFVYPSNISAQKKWTLEECINYAHQNNLQIKRQELNADISETYLKQSYFELLPNLNAGGSHNLSSGRALNTETYTWEDRTNQDGNLGIQSDLTIFNGLNNINSIKQHKFDLMRDLASVEKIKNDITLNIATSYLQVLFGYELLDLAKSQRDVTQQQVDRMKKLVEVGNRAKGDLLELEAQLSNENLNAINAENNLKINYITLIQLLELELDSIGSFQIERPEIPVIAEEELQSVNDLYQKASEIYPELKAAEFNLSAKEKALSVVRGGRYPELYLSGLYYSRYNKSATNPVSPSENYRYIDQISDNQYRQLSLNFSVPIFNRRSVESSISRSKIAVQNAEYEFDQVKKDLYKAIQEAHSDAISALAKYDASMQAVKSNEEAFSYTEQKFEVGLVNSVDYNVAKNELLKARSNFLQAKYEYIFKLKILDFYLGKPITI